MKDTREEQILRDIEAMKDSLGIGRVNFGPMVPGNEATRRVFDAVDRYSRLDYPEDTGHRDILCMLARDMQPRSYLEVGVREGHSLASVLRGADPVSLTLCDTWGDAHGGTGRGSHEHIEHLLSALCYKGTVRWFDCPSRRMWRAFSEWEASYGELAAVNFDLVHVDGDHSTEGALLDMQEGWKHTRKAMVVHDVIKSPTVAKAVELFGIPPTRVFTGDAGTGVWLK